MRSLLRAAWKVALALALMGNARAADVDARIGAILAPWSGAGPGVVAIVVRDAHVAFAKAYGMADISARTPLETATPVPLDSLTKQLTAAAVILLEHDGKLAYDDALSKHLPQVRAPGVTLRTLLQHRSGLPDLTNALPAHATLEQVVAAYAHLDLPQGREPAYSYNNTGYSLLAAVVQRVSHEPFEDFIRSRLLVPAGMAQTRFASAIQGAAHAARTYRDREIFEAPVVDQPPGGGGIVTTALDLARWYVALDNGRIVRNYEGEIRALSPDAHADSHAPSYAAGWVLGRSGTLERWSHGGSWRGSKNYVLRYPREKLTVVLLSNAYEFGTHRHQIAYEIAKLFEPALDEAGTSITTVDDACVPYTLKRTHAGVVIEGAEDIAAWRRDGHWMRDPWPYGSELQPSFMERCPAHG